MIRFFTGKFNLQNIETVQRFFIDIDTVLQPIQRKKATPLADKITDTLFQLFAIFFLGDLFFTLLSNTPFTDFDSFEVSALNTSVTHTLFCRNMGIKLGDRNTMGSGHTQV